MIIANNHKTQRLNVFVKDDQEDFTFADAEYKEKISSVIITDYYVLVVYDATVKIMDVLLKNITKVE